MGNTESSSLIPLITVFISGVFGLIVAIVTWKLANHRENRKFKYEQNILDYKEKKDLYVRLLATLDKSIRITRRDENFSNQHEELSLISAQIRILGSERINNKLYEVSDLLFEWSTEYKRGLPKKLGNTDLRMISTQDSPHIKKAEELYPSLAKQMVELAKLIEKELNDIKKKLDV